MTHPQEAGKSKGQKADDEMKNILSAYNEQAKGSSLVDFANGWNAAKRYAQSREQPWVRVSDRLPTEDDSYDDYNEVLTIQIGRQRPTMMKYWEIKHCPFTTHWMKLPPAPPKD